ncbi:hypothetical protein AB674_18865 [Flavobacterium sp. ABG]|nr:hypothetical protein AB674_18865 [Flavobacterium sp. ABG]
MLLEVYIRTTGKVWINIFFSVVKKAFNLGCFKNKKTVTRKSRNCLSDIFLAKSVMICLVFN